MSGGGGGNLQSRRVVLHTGELMNLQMQMSGQDDSYRYSRSNDIPKAASAGWWIMEPCSPQHSRILLELCLTLCSHPAGLSLLHRFVSHRFCFQPKLLCFWNSGQLQLVPALQSCADCQHDAAWMFVEKSFINKSKGGSRLVLWFSYWSRALCICRVTGFCSGGTWDALQC